MLRRPQEEAGRESMRLSRGTGEGQRREKQRTVRAYVVFPSQAGACSVDDYTSSDEEARKTPLGQAQ